MKFRSLMVAASLGAMLMAAPATAAQSVTVGVDEGGECYPFVCNDGATSFDFFQIYSKDAFSGKIIFDKITFFAPLISDLPSPTILNGDYDISFGVTSADLGTPSLPLLSGVASFYTGSLGGSDLSIAGSAYTYDPGEGNLVMRVQVSGQTAVSSELGTVGRLVADLSGEQVNRGGTVVYASGPEKLLAYGALVTQFSTSVPEPATWGMMIMGFGVSGAMLRARRRLSAAAA